MEKHKPQYQLKIKTSGKGVSTDRDHTITVREQFTVWFDEQGYLVPSRLKGFLHSVIPDLAAKKLVEEEMKVQAQKKA